MSKKLIGTFQIVAGNMYYITSKLVARHGEKKTFETAA